MPLIHWKDESPAGKAREESINKLLPKKGLVQAYLEPKLMASMKAPLLRLLRKEIRIYRDFPKKGNYKPQEFEPRNPRKCFMGQGFTANTSGVEGWTDFDLKRYREAVGTIHHPEWGECTLLEIWAADHFEKYPKMVSETFMYCWGDYPRLPELDFYINPFYKNKKTGKMQKDEVMKDEEIAAKWLIKIGHYLEIRDLMKKYKVKNPMHVPYEKEVHTT